TTFPYTLEYSKSAKVITESSVFRAPYWVNINYPEYNGIVYISYLKVDNNLMQLMEDSRSFVMKLIPKVNAIDERVIINRPNNIYGLIYEISGDKAASPYQFFLTDSVNHFVRGALYFNNVPNNDSLRPVISFIKQDMEHMIRTFRWKNL
ncbi:MAG: gliding motility lipoprotein GldD, partial [Bacteroidota bacterium]|nr:gliding motility lipoprotein GldD [Bacteroidota bacterium]